VPVIRATQVRAHACRLTRSTDLALADQSTVTVPFNAEEFDTDGMHDNTLFPSRITIRTPGVYMVGFQARVTSFNDYVVMQALLLMNTSTTIALGQFAGTPGSGGLPQRAYILTSYQFVAGDYIEAQVYQDNTTNASRDLVVDSNSPTFWAVRVAS
jgi:hypothetical protein